MKIKPNHYDILVAAIAAQKDRFNSAALAYKSAGFSKVRFAWDIMRAAGIHPGNERNADLWPVYDYADDSHIQTALFRALKDSGIDY